MPCYFPLQGWRSKYANESGKRSIVFDRKDGFEDLQVELPCGRCIGCRLEYSRKWATRLVHESMMHEENHYLTLTYSDEHLPPDYSLQLKDFQLFMKRLRKKYGNNIRYFHCGEYGDDTQRPHYHAILFNLPVNDKIYHKKLDNGHKLYVSPTLSHLWGLGHLYIGDVTFDSCAYVARYVTKKINGDLAEDHYNGRKPEYCTMSRRPGIGRTFYDKFKTDIYPHDYCVVNGVRINVPKAYDDYLEREDPETLAKIKALRKKAQAEPSPDKSTRRLRDREVCQQQRAKLLTRNGDH